MGENKDESLFSFGQPVGWVALATCCLPPLPPFCTSITWPTWLQTMLIAHSFKALCSPCSGYVVEAVHDAHLALKLFSTSSGSCDLGAHLDLASPSQPVVICECSQQPADPLGIVHSVSDSHHTSIASCHWREAMGRGRQTPQLALRLGRIAVQQQRRAMSTKKRVRPTVHHGRLLQTWGAISAAS